MNVANERLSDTLLFPFAPQRARPSPSDDTRPQHMAFSPLRGNTPPQRALSL